MLPNSVGSAKGKAPSRTNTLRKDGWSSVRSSLAESEFSICPNPSRISTKSASQYWACDKDSRHTCMRCSFLTMCKSNTSQGRMRKKTDTEKKECAIEKKSSATNTEDPRIMSPEELIQFELNTAIQQFKADFNNPKKSKKYHLRFKKSVQRIIELLNPNLLLLYKRCGNYKKQQIKEHFFRTSEKAEQTYLWHKAALEFIMERLDIDPYTIIPKKHTTPPPVPMVKDVESEREIETDSSSITDISDDFEEKNPRRLEQKQSKKKLRTTGGDDQTFVVPPQSSSDTTLVFVKPTDWLTETTCPHCRLKLRLSEFSKHYATYHCLPIQCMNVCETRQISLDPKRLLSRRICPHTLFLVRNVVRDLGGSDFRNFYPLVLTSAVRQTFEAKGNQLMLWLSGIFLSDQIEISLKVTNPAVPRDSVDHCKTSRQIYHIKKSQCLRDIFESEASVIISPDFLVGTTKHVENIIVEVSVKFEDSLGALCM